MFSRTWRRKVERVEHNYPFEMLSQDAQLTLVLAQKESAEGNRWERELSKAEQEWLDSHG